MKSLFKKLFKVSVKPFIQRISGGKCVIEVLHQTDTYRDRIDVKAAESAADRSTVRVAVEVHHQSVKSFVISAEPESGIDDCTAHFAWTDQEVVIKTERL